MNALPYYIGAILALVYKFGRYAYVGITDQKKTFRQCLAEWTLAPTAENTTSWVTTIGVVWMIGGWLVGAFSFTGEPQSWLPTHPSVLFTVGTLSEMLAPAIAKWLMAIIVNRFTGGSQ